MATSYTNTLQLAKQGAGENANTWGTILNDNVIDMVILMRLQLELRMLETLEQVYLNKLQWVYWQPLLLLFLYLQGSIVQVLVTQQQM